MLKKGRKKSKSKGGDDSMDSSSSSSESESEDVDSDGRKNEYGGQNDFRVDEIRIKAAHHYEKTNERATFDPD